jgi:hypothetical protein
MNGEANGDTAKNKAEVIGEVEWGVGELHPVTLVPAMSFLLG